MYDSMSNRLGGPLAAFAIGAAVGAGLALLYAPYSGEETRQLLARRSRDIKNRVTGAVGATIDSMTEHRASPTV